MISRTSRYAVRSVLYLAVHSHNSHLIGVKDLAQALRINEPTLSKILQLLTRRKFIISKKGRNGGFYMTEAQKNQKLMNIILSVERVNQLMPDCLLDQENCHDCSDCPYDQIVDSIRKDLNSIYNSDTIIQTAQKLILKNS